MLIKHDSLAEPEPITIVRRPEAAPSHRPRLRRGRPRGAARPAQDPPLGVFLRRRGLGPVRADLRAARVLPDPHRGRDPPRPRRRDGGRLDRRPDPDRAGQRQLLQDAAADRGRPGAVRDAALRPDRRLAHDPRGVGADPGAPLPRAPRDRLRRQLPDRPGEPGRAHPGPKLLVFLGSSLGNYEADDAAGLLGQVARALGPGRPLLARHRPGQGPRPARGGLRRRPGRDRPVQSQHPRPDQPRARGRLRPRRSSRTRPGIAPTWAASRCTWSAARTRS